jgi:putative transposase
VLTVVAQEGSEKSAAQASGSLLDELVRDGARQMLAAALQAEVAAYVEQFADVVDEDGHRLVVRIEWRGPLCPTEIRGGDVLHVHSDLIIARRLDLAAE